jgi:diguanylate cyclase (GGDEF)-like protein
MVLITVGFAAVVIAVLGVLTVQGILPYAPLFIEQRLSASPAYAAFYFMTQVYFVMPFLVVSIAVSLLFLQQSRRREAQILHLSQTDSLTQLYNRRTAQAHLATLMQNPAGYPISVVLLDLDFFKKINDSYGHLTGDRVLKAVSQVLRDSLRKNDLIARFGGEEFLLILDGIPCNAAEKVAERCRVLLMNATVLNDEGQQITLTGSFGVACILTGGQVVIDDILRQADQALYRAKENGRNQVVRHACPYQQAGLTNPQAQRLGEQIAAAARLP